MRQSCERLDEMGCTRLGEARLYKEGYMRLGCIGLDKAKL